MNTIVADRLFSDPRYRMLSDRMKCPFRALGLLVFVWHGTQNMGGVILAADQILSSIPLGTRRDRRYIDLLEDCGWLVRQPEDDQSGGPLYRIVGNSDHVKARDKLSESGKRGAEKRWGSLDGQAILKANGTGYGLSPHLNSPHLTSRDPDRARAREAEGLKLGSSHPEVAFFEARHRELFPGALAYGAKERARAAEVIRRCAENCRKWQDVLEAYSDPRWSFALGSLDWLRDHLGELTQWIADGKPKRGKPEEAPARVQPPSAEETSRRIAERNKRWQDEDAKSAEVAKRFFANGGKL